MDKLNLSNNVLTVVMTLKHSPHLEQGLTALNEGEFNGRTVDEDKCVNHSIIDGPVCMSPGFNIRIRLQYLSQWVVVKSREKLKNEHNALVPRLPVIEHEVKVRVIFPIVHCNTMDNNRW